MSDGQITITGLEGCKIFIEMPKPALLYYLLLEKGINAGPWSTNLWGEIYRELEKQVGGNNFNE